MKLSRDERFAEGAARTVALVEQQAVAAETGGEALDGGGSDAELGGDLPQGGATEQAMEQRRQQLGVAQPVADPERLIAERAAAVSTPVPLDAPRWTAAMMEAVAHEVPTVRLEVERARGIGTERRCMGGGEVVHTRPSLAALAPSRIIATQPKR